MNDAYCFVCSRCTDHFAEHDDLVDMGIAAYDAESGSVYVVDYEALDRLRQS